MLVARRRDQRSSAASTPATPVSSYTKVPFFGDIPVLGWLFKNRRENDDRTEILIFITPKITQQGLPALQQRLIAPMPRRRPSS